MKHMDSYGRKMYPLFVLVLLSAVFSLFLPAGCCAGGKKAVDFRGNTFFVEIAETKQDQERGLMFIKNLPADSGMLFVYEDEARRSFYMKNTYVPLDIIWMDREKRVVFIKKDARPGDAQVYETIHPQEEAMYVLELNSGSAEKIGLRPGDILQF
ncbi:MAG: DUF192 domain-containing protein [Candidatus Omnitrophica bacterium]|nr:DUF192 domain-containing protein [Candidatus Omnitrophota bacterium]MDD5771254.1 DUF192 domain-containing protein [Candidatus Omnitrophota bacterium]